MFVVFANILKKGCSHIIFCKFLAIFNTSDRYSYLQNAIVRRMLPHCRLYIIIQKHPACSCFTCKAKHFMTYCKQNRWFRLRFPGKT